MTKIKYIFGAALVVALVAGPTAAYATAEPVEQTATETEVTSSQDTLITPETLPPTEPTSGTSLTSQETTAPTVTIPIAETGTLPGESPAESSQPTVPEATSPTTVAPQPSAGTTPTTSPNYTTALFEIQGGDWTKPQKFIAAIPGATLTGFGNLLKCGTDYQVDIYKPLADGTKPDVLWETGYLLYAHDGPFLAYDLPYTPYKLFTTDDCEVIPSPSTPPQTVSPTPPSQPTAGVPSSQPTTGPSIAPSPSTPSQAGVNVPRTVSPVTSSTTAPATAKPATNSLAMTGSDSWKYAVAAALLIILIGAFAVYDARKYRKFKRNNPFK